MGGIRGQRWFRLSWYEDRGDRSPADACAEYRPRLDLMTVARFQKCVPLCVYELWKLSDWGGGRGALSRTPQSICVLSQGLYRSSCLIRLCWRCRLLLCFCFQVHEQLWPIDRGSCVARTSRYRRISIQFISVWGKKKKKSFSSGNKNMSTLIHVKKRLYPCPWWACVFVRQQVCVFVCVCWLKLKLSPALIFCHQFYTTKARHCTVSLELKLTLNLTAMDIKTFLYHIIS